MVIMEMKKAMDKLKMFIKVFILFLVKVKKQIEQLSEEGSTRKKNNHNVYIFEWLPGDSKE